MPFECCFDAVAATNRGPGPAPASLLETILSIGNMCETTNAGMKDQYIAVARPSGDESH